jgi:pyruvate carboxylase
VVETAPAQGLPPVTRAALFEDAKRITSAANYLCAGTVEFLVDKQGRHYFIEVNPRVQVGKQGPGRPVRHGVGWSR